MMKKKIALVIVIVLLIFGGGIFENLHAAGIQIDPPAGLTTTEDGGEATFLVRLTSPPVCTQNCFVEIYVSSSDITEGYILSPPSFNFLFDANNYNEFQEVMVRGVDDPFPDGDQDYFVRIQVVNTNDPNYSGLTQQAAVTNIDNEGPYTPPTATLTGDPILNEGQAGTYNANNSYPSGSIVSYEWDWDYNGNVFIPSGDTGITQNHTWMDDGNYRVAVRVTDFMGVSDIADLVVIVNDLAPTADFFWRQAAPEEGDVVDFQDNSTSYPDSIVEFNWDFYGLGTSTDQNPSFTFNSDYAYVVTLTVTDEDGSDDVISRDVIIADKNPVADFSADTREGGVPLTVNFTDESTSYDGIYIYSWNFGDGNIATGVKSPIHTYNAVGTYNVSLTVLEADGDTNIVTKNNYIAVKCTDNDECLIGAYCQKEIGDCEGLGECIDRPAVCSREWDPVCGCDGETYTNACMAARNGININYVGECSGLAKSAWPCKGYNFKRAGQSPYVGAQTSNLDWTYAIGTPIKSSPAIDANGTIYVGSDDGNVYALNPNGSLKWSYETGGGIGSSPAIDANGTIYVGSDDGNVYALNPGGSLKWNYQTGGINNYSSPAIGYDGTIYVGSNDGNVYAFNTDGSLKWNYETTSAGLNSSPAISSDETIYIGGSNEGKVYALNPDGSLQWSYETGAGTFASPAIDANGIIYIGCSLRKLHALYPDAADPNNRLKWSYETGYEIGSTPAIGADGTIYIGSGDGRVYALNEYGGLKWSYQTGDRILWSSPAIGADGTIYIGSDDGKVYALNNDGGLKWSYQTGAKYIRSSPAIGADGTVYIGGRDGIVYAFKDTNLQAVNLWIEPYTMKMISFIHWPDNPNAVSVFGDQVWENYQYKALFKIGTYNPELGNYIEYGANLIVEPGRSYWCYAKDGLNISFNGVPVKPDDDIKVDLLFDSNTNDGWNMIACPYNTNYLWDDVQVWGCDPNAKTISELAMENDCNCIDRLLLWKWKNGTYAYYDPDPNSTCGNEPNEYERDSDPYMKPNEGYWVKVKKENVYLRFPPLNMPKIKDSHANVLISGITSKEKKLPSASRRAITNAGGDSPPAPLGGFRSNEAGLSETGSGGCFINNMSFGLPKDTLKKNDKFRIKR